VPISSTPTVAKRQDASGRQLHQVTASYTGASTSDWIELSTATVVPSVLTLLAVHAYGESGTAATRQVELVVHTAGEDTAIPAGAKRLYQSKATAVATQIADSLGAGIPAYVPAGSSLYILPGPNTGSDNAGTIEVVLSPTIGPA